MFRFSEKTKKSGDIISIPVNNIRANPDRPRKTFTWDDLDGLAQSIYQNGLLQPITVRQLENGKYELVAGERRLRAAKMAGLAEIPSIVVRISDEKSAVFAIIENLQRKDLHFFEEAQAIDVLVKKYGMTGKQIAKKLGKSPATVSNKLRLLKLPKSIRDFITANGLTERHARAILRLPDYNLMSEVSQAILRNSLNVADTEALIDRILEENRPSEIKEQKKQKKDLKVFKDVRLFINTLDHAVITMQKSGINANSFQRESDNYVEYVVRINKSDVSRETLTK